MTKRWLNGQFEFVGWAGERRRPPGGGHLLNGFFIYKTESQTLAQVAYTLNCSVSTVMRHIEEGSILGAVDISTDKASKACYRVPRQSVIDFIEERMEGAK